MVVIAAVCYTMIAKAPVIFLAQGEAENGQMDVFIQPVSTYRHLTSTLSIRVVYAHTLFLSCMVQTMTAQVTLPF